MKRMLCLVLSLVMLSGLCALLSSCGDSSPVVMEYRGFRITQNQFIYELALEKTAYLSENDLSADNASLWAKTTAGGITVDEACMNGLIRSEVLKLYFASYATEEGYGLTAEEDKLIEDSMQKYVANFSDRKSFDAYMKNFSVDYAAIRDLMRLQYLSQKGQALLFGTGKSEEVTEADAVAFFNENYVTVKHIYINHVNKTYPNQKTVPLTDGEKQEKLSLIADLEKKITPESFASLLSFSEDGFQKEGAEAVTFGKGSRDSAYEAAAFGCDVGKVAKAECADGVYFIRREPLQAEVLTKELKEEIQLLLTQKALDKLFDTAKSNTVMNAQILNLYSFSQAKYFTNFESQ